MAHYSTKTKIIFASVLLLILLVDGVGMILEDPTQEKASITLDENVSELIEEQEYKQKENSNSDKNYSIITTYDDSKSG